MRSTARSESVSRSAWMPAASISSGTSLPRTWHHQIVHGSVSLAP